MGFESNKTFLLHLLSGGRKSMEPRGAIYAQEEENVAVHGKGS